MYSMGQCWFLSKRAASWTSARDQCRAMHGAADLMVPTTNRVADFVMDLRTKWLGLNSTSWKKKGSYSMFPPSLFLSRGSLKVMPPVPMPCKT